jgi:hypothetical protein
MVNRPTIAAALALLFALAPGGPMAWAAEAARSAPPLDARSTAGSAGPSRLGAEGASLVLQDLRGAAVHPLTNDGRVATVFFFVMHECPVANSYAPEIGRILAEYAKRGVRGHVVYVESDLAVAQARKHAQAYGYAPEKTGGTAPLLDPGHRLVRAVGATVSPEAIVVSQRGEVLYTGRIDDRVADFGKRRVQPTRRDLRLALEAIVAGQPVPARQTKAVGCYIPVEPADGARAKTNNDQRPP